MGSQPAGTLVHFTLMIARQGNSLDLFTRFTDGESYDQSQNLLNLARSEFDYNRLAFLMTGNLNATWATFSKIGITQGRALPQPVTPSTSGGPIANWKVLFAASPLTVGGVEAIDLVPASPVFGGSALAMDGIGVAGRFGTQANAESVTLAVGDTLTVSAAVTLTGGNDVNNHDRFAVLNDGGQFTADRPENWGGGWLHSVGNSLYQASTGPAANFMSTLNSGNKNAVSVSPNVDRFGDFRGDSALPYA